MPTDVSVRMHFTHVYTCALCISLKCLSVCVVDNLARLSAVRTFCGTCRYSVVPLHVRSSNTTCYQRLELF